jgi:hypothetical protein
MLYKDYGNKRRTIPEDSTLLDQVTRICKNSEPDLTERWSIAVKTAVNGGHYTKRLVIGTLSI